MITVNTGDSFELLCVLLTRGAVLALGDFTAGRYHTALGEVTFAVCDLRGRRVDCGDAYNAAQALQAAFAGCLCFD